MRKWSSLISWKGKTRNALRRVGLEVRSRSDYSAIAAISQFLGPFSSTAEGYATGRLLMGINRFKSMGAVPTSQLLQDVLAEGEVADFRYFVDVGAGHPVQFSNTRMLSQVFGWHGLRVDPNPHFAALHRDQAVSGVAFCEAVVGTQEGDLATIMLAGGLTTRAELSNADSHAAERRLRVREQGTARVPVRRLDTLLDEVGAPEWIDFMSVDTEGSELEVLRSFPWRERECGLLTIEHNFDGRKLQAIEALLESVGMIRVLRSFSSWDAWFTHERLISGCDR